MMALGSSTVTSKFLSLFFCSGGRPGEALGSRLASALNAFVILAVTNTRLILWCRKKRVTTDYSHLCEV